ncbi:MAG: APC family permease [Nocardioidaceae bacterium]
MPRDRLSRRLGTTDAVLIGLGAMMGAGVFAAFTPAAQAAGPWLVVGLLLAAGVAYCNATSSARLAAIYPESGGTYVYGRKRLGEFWGYLAGWGFVVGKTASCAAMALTVGSYVWPDLARPIAIAVVVALTALNYFGIHKSALATRVIVAIVLGVLTAVVAACLLGGHSQTAHLDLTGDFDLRGVIQAAGFLFFAFAGYARIATLGEEVRDPARTIPRAIPIALGITFAFYLAVGVSVLAVLGADGVADSPAPLVDAVSAGSASALEPLVRVGGAVAALGSLLAMILGVSRTTFAMASDGHLPHALDAVHPRHRVPYRAELMVGIVVIAVVLFADVRGAIGFSSFAVLVYYSIANASAFTLNRAHGVKWVPALGLVGCLVLAFSLPWTSTSGGAAVLVLGCVVYVVRRRRRGDGQAQSTAADRPSARPNP